MTCTDQAWTPTTRQREFLASAAYEALYGGAAGGGKSEALLVAALRWVHVPHYRALLLRRTFPDLERSLIDRSRGLYRARFPSADYIDGKRTWRFPSGATIAFGHIEHEADKLAYQSAEYSFIGFDELTHFTESQYTYMLSRARSSKGLPVRVRAATNPGGEGHDWVFRRWAPWLDPSTDVHAGPGEALAYRNGVEGEVWLPPEVPMALSRVFIPARVVDNPHLVENDPTYIERLRGLDPLTRAQLLDGNWLARAAEGALFKARWFEPIPATPTNVVSRVRYWDRASSPEPNGQTGSRDPDYTVGVRLARTRDGFFVVEDVARFRGRPQEVVARIKATAARDGRSVSIGIEQDPGSAGEFEADFYVRELSGLHVRKIRPTGDKVTRAMPASAQCEAGRVKVLPGPWNRAFLDELEAFPDGNHDDQVDAFSGAFTMVANPPPSILALARYQEMMPKARGWTPHESISRQREILRARYEREVGDPDGPRGEYFRTRWQRNSF